MGTQSQAGLGAAGPCRSHQVRALDSRCRKIGGQLFTGSDIAPGAKSVAATGGNRQRLAPKTGIVILPVGEQLRKLVGVALFGIAVDAGTRQLVQQVVAFAAGGLFPAQQKVYRQATLGTGEGGGAAVVALQTAAGNQGVVTLGKRVGDDKLELANLVATEQTAAQVVPLDPESLAAAPALTGPSQVLQRGGPAGQFDPRRQLKRSHQAMDLSVPFGSTA
jgi:hypothetical protein